MDDRTDSVLFGSKIRITGRGFLYFYRKLDHFLSRLQ